jgi:uncharacterized protein (UPF0332 family)
MEHEFWEKAQENLKAAEVLFEQRLYNASANRSYYAALQAAITALAEIGITTDRISHEAAQATFATELIHRRKRYASHLKSYLITLHAVRNDADYGVTSISKKVAARQLKKAREFIEEIRKGIEQ